MEKMDTSMEQQFDLNLIEAVRINPVIYDRSHYNYKHFVRKAQVWKQISETLGVPEQKCTKRWKSLRDKFAREIKLSTGSRWRYFKQMQFLVESIRQYRESLLGKCGPITTTAGNASNTTNQVTQQQAQQPAQQQQQSSQQQHTVVDLFHFNGTSVPGATQALHPHVTGDNQLTATTTTAGKDQKTFYYEPVLKRERLDDDQHNENMLNPIKIFQNTISSGVSAEDQSFGLVVTEMLNTLGVRQKAEAKVHIIKYLTDMQLVAQHNKF
ncbi:transcription factor Adf-1-like isoform X2 [Glossina fuscipes]|uniref:Transcription factor Adf-1-like isoform X2 n=1 Tax=Glossina fuscipes TaxID=7396 RepID=A0A8U0WN17_9MUSC|nr:transcription factor Adf-1-like isoform X2 [Glossina fuscipes]